MGFGPKSFVLVLCFFSRFARLNIPISGIIETSTKDLFQSLLTRLLIGKMKYSVTLQLENLIFFHRDLLSDYLDQGDFDGVHIFLLSISIQVY